MSKTIGWLLLALVVGGGLGAFYYLWKNPQSEPATELAVPAPQEEGEGSAARHPIPEQQTDPDAGPQPLPELNLSDQPVKNALGELYGEPPVARYVMPDKIIRRIVITVDNLSREKLAVQMRPLKPVTGQFAVTGDADAGDPVTLNPANYARYEPVMKLVAATDTAKLAGLYFRLYPLFQQAYEELGYPGSYFNDRLVETIDHLLETPEVQDEIRLVRPKVFYEFADPELEERSSGQKLLIRMGPDNAGVVKEKLRALRAELVQNKTG